MLEHGEFLHNIRHILGGFTLKCNNIIRLEIQLKDQHLHSLKGCSQLHRLRLRPLRDLERIVSS